MQNLTINVPTNLSSTSTSPSTSSGISSGAPTDRPLYTPHKSSNAGAIAGGVIGGVGGAAILCGLFFLSRCRRHPHRVSIQTEPVPFTHEISADLSSMTETPTRRPGIIGVKGHEAMLERRNASELNPSTLASSSNVTTSGQTPFAAATTTPVADTTGSHPDAHNLRTEMENLVRLVQTLHEARFEPPPDYESEIRA